LGYSVSHAYGTVFDHPDLISVVMVGDGESETGPLATSWHGNKFVNPITDGAVLPVLHLNGYKINNPTVLARISHEEPKASRRVALSGTRHVCAASPPIQHWRLPTVIGNWPISEWPTIRTLLNASKPNWGAARLGIPRSTLDRRFYS